MDRGFFTLLLPSTTGLALLAGRNNGAMGVLLAMLKRSIEKRQPNQLPLSSD